MSNSTAITRLSKLFACGSAMAAVSATLSAGAFAQTAPAAEAETPVGEVVVTAQRRQETASKVPISIASYSNEKMDEQGIRAIDDLSRLTPALNFTTSAGVNGVNSSSISVRGVASDVGSATTAIYVDDTPIQIRNIGYLGGNPYPRVFDLERVEVLRGPQGTLFGAGAQGGAVRFIAAQPDFINPQVYARTEIATIDQGGMDYEAGLAIGLPITDNLAFRASGWHRRDGGYIDKINPQTGQLLAADINTQDTTAGKFALSWRPVETVTITPSVFYQKLEVAARDEYWEGYGDQAAQNYQTGVHTPESTTDRFVLPALKVELDLGSIGIVSNSSYFDRKQDQLFSYGTYQSFLRSGNPFGNYSDKDPNNSNLLLTGKQQNFVQEVRAFSQGESSINWIVGLYYSKTDQYFRNLTGSGRTPGNLFAGLPQYEGRYSWFQETTAKDEQIAGYANVDWNATEKLTLSAAARVSHNSFHFQDVSDGPIVGNVETTINAAAKESSFTPKFTVKYQLTPGSMFYVTASKGFRPGGAQPRVNPDYCANDLAALGMTESPGAYKSDSLWNYEAGAKSRLFGNRLSIDVSAYQLKWKNIQQAINLPLCNFKFVGNLGSATGRGVELSLAVRPTSGLEVGGNVAYTNIRFDDDVLAGNGGLLREADQRFGGPLWSGSVFSQYEADLSSDVAGYARADYSFTRKNTLGAIQGTFGFDPDLPLLPGTDYLTVRAGLKINGLDVSVFAENLTNSRDVKARNHDGLGGSLYYLQSHRPRTIGVTGQYRF